MQRTRWFTPLVTACFLAAAACSGDNNGANLVPDGGPAAGGPAGAGSGAGAGAGSGGGTAGSGVGSGDGGVVIPGSAGMGWTVPTTILELCDGPCECSDGLDNDNDGEADGFDVECVSAGDNDEGSFATAIPGDNRDPKWQDCFFDGNSGAGDDGCKYHTDCLTGARDPSDADCELAQDCIDFCKPLTPNGCDCFGCCEIRDAQGDTFTVLISSTCDETDLAGCTQCVRATDCENKCGECELCPGKSVDDLPESCAVEPPTAGTSGGTAGTTGSTAGTTGGTAGTGSTEPPGYMCDGGEQVCASTGDCAGGTYCAFGCCLQIPPE